MNNMTQSTPDNSALTFTTRCLVQMANMQDVLNCRLFTNWREHELDWDAAILVEGAELIDHLEWKWWSKQKKEPNFDQARMEAVDILHFLLSRIIETRDKEQVLAVMEAAAPTFEIKPTSLRPSAKTVIMRTQRFMAKVLGEAGDDQVLQEYGRLLYSLGLGFDDLYKKYIGKGVLNQFRWSNGYGSTYSKNWLGEEDNEFLTRLISGLDAQSASFVQNVEKGLSERYSEVVSGQVGYAN